MRYRIMIIGFWLLIFGCWLQNTQLVTCITRPFQLICGYTTIDNFSGICYGETKGNKLVQINVAGIALKVELAVTEEEQMRGLMYRDKLDENSGMLFVFAKEQTLYFWMKNTRIPLSIAYIKADGRIIQIESMKPYCLDSIASKETAKYALEMNDGWFKANKVKVGDVVEIVTPY